ncbi:MAG: hypothetical protein M3Y68_06105 [Chloroflexota bacterium]|nr:hypothetical protein [Chloroflexota bacterium]
MKRLPWFEIILIIVVMSMSLYAALSDPQNLSWRWFTRDDAYYYFKVAQNISEGRGSTFDGINQTNGYHPLWMLVCIPIFALARFDLILPLRVLLLVMSGLSVATAILLYRFIGRIFMPAIGAVAALFWVFHPDVLVTLYQNGLESGIAAFFIVLLLYSLYGFERSWRTNGVSSRRIAILAVIAALVMFSRLDLVFLAVVVGLWVIFRGSLLRFFLPVDITLIVLSTLVSFLIRVDISGYYQDANVALLMISLSLVIKTAGAFLFGLYQRAIVLNPGLLFKRLVVFTLASSAILGLLMLAILSLGWVQGSFSRLVLLIDLGLTFLLFGISRLALIGLRRADEKPSGEPSTVPQSPLDDLREHWRRWMREGALYYGIVLGSLAAYMVWSKLVFGTSSPVSGQIKQWWASLPGRAYGGAPRDILAFFGLSYTTDSDAWRPLSRIVALWSERLQWFFSIEDTWRYLFLLGLLAIVFYLILLLRRRKARTALVQMSLIPLLSGACLQILYYGALGSAAQKEWYWISQLVVLTLAFSLLLGILYRLLRPVPYRQLVAWGFAAYVGMVMGTSYWTMVRNQMPYGHWEPQTAYMDIVPLLEENTEPGSLIGFTGGGNVGYFISDRTIVNMDGLINSYDYFQALQAREAGAYLHQIGLDYVLANPVILDQQPYKEQFNPYLEPLRVSYGGKQLMRYRMP